MEYKNTPSQSYVTECGIHLGVWCNRQRSNKKSGKLSTQRIELLEKIPNWFWEQDLDEQWYKKYTLLKEYSDTPSQKYITKCGVKLGSWCNEQKQNKKKENLSKSQIELLEKIPNWSWDKNEQWYEKYTLLKAYNDTPINSYITKCGFKLGSWCSHQRTKKNKLSTQQIELLEKIPNWYWEQDLDEQWNKKYTFLKEYNDTPSQCYITNCGIKLGNWCSEQRQNKKKEILSKSKIELLEKISNWYWEQDLDEQWNKKYTFLKEYNDTPNYDYITKCGVKLGFWCSTQRQYNKSGKLSQEQIELLEKIPNWFWDKFVEQWNKYYTLLKEYNDTPTQSYVTSDGIHLGCWTNTQRQNKKKHKLSQDKIELLEKYRIGIGIKRTCPNQRLNLQSKQDHTNHKVSCLTP